MRNNHKILFLRFTLNSPFLFMHKAIGAAVQGGKAGMVVTAKTKTKVKVKPTSGGRSLSGGKR